MVVFAILMDRSGFVSADQGHPGEIVINKADHQLPLAIVTFNRVPVAQLQIGPAFARGFPGMRPGMFPGMPGMPVPAMFQAQPQAQPWSGPGRRLGGGRTSAPQQRGGQGAVDPWGVSAMQGGSW